MTYRFLTALGFSIIAACGGGGGNGGGNDTQATSKPAASSSSLPPPPLPSFVDATAASNISFVVDYTSPLLGENDVYPSTYGGAAAGDCDSDGDIDLFITYGDTGPNRLYINQLDLGNPLSFSDNAAVAGVANTRDDGRGNDRHSGPTFADMDGDGDLDLFLGGLFSDPSKIYANDGNCRFEDVTAGSGIESLLADHTISAAFGDYDLDGDLDMFLTHWGSPLEFTADGESEHLFRNVSSAGTIRFENASQETGVTKRLMDIRAFDSNRSVYDFTFTPTFARINDDLWPDITLATDFGMAQLLLNDLSAHDQFIDSTNEAIHSVQFAMGSALGDIDFDGDLDWFVTSIREWNVSEMDPPELTGNHLFRNSGSDFSETGFEDITSTARVHIGGWGWAACFLDFDNDTDLDIYHTNGWPMPFLGDSYANDRSRVFRSNGDATFTQVAEDLGLDDDKDGRGIVCADFDNDGDIDILQLTNDERNSATLWNNVRAAAGNNFLRVQLVGLQPNTEAAGARIFVTIGSRTQMREIMIGSNYTSQNPTVQVFGLGTDTVVDTLRVEWPPLAPGPTQPPDTVRTIVPAGSPNQTLVLCHPELLPAPARCD